MLPGRRDAEGRLDVTTDLPAASTTYHGGIAINAVGQVHIINASPNKFVNGFGVTHTGQLCASSEAAVDYLEGLPRTALGKLKIQTDTVPAATDPFVGGIRVGPLGGVYTTLTAPPVGDPPINTVRPDITGIPQVGEILTCSTGTWSNTPTAYAYQWFQEGTPLVGETASTHTVTVGDDKNVLTCRVVATNAAGGAQAFSNAVFIGGAHYIYTTSNSQTPAPGNIVNNTGSLIMRMNRIDLDGIDRYGALSQLQPGDSIFVGLTEGVIANPTNFNGDVAQLYLVSWVGPANGEYTVRVELA